MLSLDNDEIKAEFKIATHQALENMQDEFVFYGHVITTTEAVEAVDYIESRRTYH